MSFRHCPQIGLGRGISYCGFTSTVSNLVDVGVNGVVCDVSFSLARHVGLLGCGRKLGDGLFESV